MVSLRRRRLLGLCSGKNCFPVQIPKDIENGNVHGSHNQNANSGAVHPLASNNVIQPQEVNVPKTCPISSNICSGSSKEEPRQEIPEQRIKRRKRHRRKQFQDQEPCILRGVYFKNSKWQAAIKVEKKQIHLGTVGSQEEAAHLYDRAAFMCGREPNFELPEEEKQELRRLKWDEFLAITRSSITNKRNQRKVEEGSRKKPRDSLHGNNWLGEHQNGFPTSEGVQRPTSLS